MLAALQQDAQFDLKVVALGTHVSHHFSYTIDQLVRDGFSVIPVASLILGEGAEATATGMGTTTVKFGSLWALERPDAILCIGDRFEIFAAVMASVPFGIPVIHFHGGETTLGSLDEIYRTGITAASSLHFCATESYADRVRDILGEHRGKDIHAVGALAIDAIRQTPLLSEEDFDRRFGTKTSEPTVLFTFHPVTAGSGESVEPCLEVLAELPHRKLITMPNVDHGSGNIARMIEERFGSDSRTAIHSSLGREGFYSALSLCSLVLGNSSAGIIEASYFGTPVVNVGSRQDGRIRPANVIDCDNDVASIRQAVAAAAVADRKVDTSVYGDGTAAQKALATIKAYFNAR